MTDDVSLIPLNRLEEEIATASYVNSQISSLNTTLTNQINLKQNILTAGDNISIANNVISSSDNPDNLTINKDSNDKIQAIGVYEKNTNAIKYDWIGTIAQYNEQNIATTHPDWVCYITDDGGLYFEDRITYLEELIEAKFQRTYPVGSIFLTVNNSSPEDLLEFGKWRKVSEGKCIWGANTVHHAGESIEAGIPNFKLHIGYTGTEGNANPNGGAESGGRNFPRYSDGEDKEIDLSSVSSVYKDNFDTVQPPAFCVNIWQRYE